MAAPKGEIEMALDICSYTVFLIILVFVLIVGAYEWLWALGVIAYLFFVTQIPDDGPEIG